MIPLSKRYDLSERAILLTVRWIMSTILCLLFIYSPTGPGEPSMWLRLVVVSAYMASNGLLTWLTRKVPLEKLTIPVFLTDVTLLSAALYCTIHPETDLYLMCFLIIYLSTLSRRSQDSLPLAITACCVYGLLTYYRSGSIPWTDPASLLRFTFLFVLALFMSYLADQAEHSRQKISEMQKVQGLLAAELQKTLIELRNKQSALIQAEKLTAMGHMAGALAHEIRNPLSVILGYVEDLLQSTPEPDTLKMCHLAIKRSAERCIDLMQNLLSFSRQPRESEHFLLKDALQEAITLVKIGAKMTQVQVVFDVLANPTINARRSEVQQVIVNLMTNAIDAMPKGGNLTLRLEEEDRAGKHWVKITVEDNGEGIPDSVRQHIFEPFYTTKPVGKGTGLGLSIVQDIVRQYEGYLEVESVLHKGTKMIVRWPCELSAEEPAKAA